MLLYVVYSILRTLLGPSATTKLVFTKPCRSYAACSVIIQIKEERQQNHAKMVNYKGSCFVIKIKVVVVVILMRFKQNLPDDWASTKQTTFCCCFFQIKSVILVFRQ